MAVAVEQVAIRWPRADRNRLPFVELPSGGSCMISGSSDTSRDISELHVPQHSMSATVAGSTPVSIRQMLGTMPSVTGSPARWIRVHRRFDDAPCATEAARALPRIELGLDEIHLRDPTNPRQTGWPTLVKLFRRAELVNLAAVENGNPSASVIARPGHGGRRSSWSSALVEPGKFIALRPAGRHRDWTVARRTGRPRLPDNRAPIATLAAARPTGSWLRSSR